MVDKYVGNVANKILTTIVTSVIIRINVPTAEGIIPSVQDLGRVGD